jgi:hypothetical protein
MSKHTSSNRPSSSCTAPPIRSTKTKTLPEHTSDSWFEGPDPVTWIQIFGTAHRYELPRSVKVITVGAAEECDVVIKSPYVSRLHCTLERRYDCLRVEDRSKNGTFVDDRRMKEPKDVRPGETFAVAGGITFLALNDPMHAAYPSLSDVLGWEDRHTVTHLDGRWPTPSDVTVWGAGSDHILITGERGCDQERLIRAIHSISPMRAREIVWVDDVPDDRASQKELLLRASRNTLALNVHDRTPVMDEAFRTSLFSASYRIRVLVCAPSMARVLAVLGPDHSLMRRVDLRPLAYRTEQIERLLDRELEARGSMLRVAQLTGKNRDALRSCEWRGNFEDLRVAAERVDALARAGSVRGAASALGVPYSTLQKWLANTVGITLPLTSSR